jgi:hypothetical protein
MLGGKREWRPRFTCLTWRVCPVGKDRDLCTCIENQQMKPPAVISMTSVHLFAFHTGRPLKATSVQMWNIFTQSLPEIVRGSSCTKFHTDPTYHLCNLAKFHGFMDYSKSKVSKHFFGKGPHNKYFSIWRPYAISVAYSSLSLFFKVFKNVKKES